MKIYNRFFVGLLCFVLLFLSFAKDNSHAAPCSPLPSVQILENPAYEPLSIQDAYNYASVNLGLSSFTLRLAEGIFTEDLTLNGGAVVIDGGYDCTFTNQLSTSSVFGTITIAGGSLNFTAETQGFKVVSTDQCAFDTDLDGYTRIGSCSGTADDCNDNAFDINPDAIEICDGIDNNCNGQIDEGAVGIDADGDGYFAEGSCGVIGDDCNDNNANINPGAVDIPYDGIDQDCSGLDLRFAEDNLPQGENCGVCHGIAPTQWDDVHAQISAPDTTCAACHNALVTNTLSGHYGKTVRTTSISNNMTAGEIIVCNSCHDQISDEHNFGDSTVMAKVFAAWNSFTPITCNTCHENQAAYHQSAHDNRVITAICADCHTSDTSVIGQPGTGTLASQADVDTLHRSDCAVCHGYSGSKLNPTIVAQAIQAGINGTPIDCLECHTDFGTIHAFLDNHNSLVTVGSSTCGNCHSNPPPLTSLTDPKAHSSCFNCHDADYNTIGLAAGKTFAAGGDCTTCHTSSWEALHLNDPPDHTALVQVASTNCGSCHDNTLTSAAAKTHDGCFNCHDPATGDLVTKFDTNLQTFFPGGDCTTCHTDPFDLVHPDNIDHSALIKVATTGCADCHSDPPPLVDADPINANDPKLHDACASCHDAEGALINLAAGKSFASPGNCTTCHSASFDTFHPSDIDHSALVKVATTSCGNCHSDPPPLVDPADAKVHNACLSCHNVEGRLINEAAGKTFAAGGNCATCHTGAFDTVHPEDVDHSLAIQLSIDCNGCHAGPPPVIDPVDPTVHDACIICHDADGGLISIASGNPAPNECISCHGGDLNALHPTLTANHNATPGSDHVLIFAAGNHDTAMVGDGTVDIACSNCHSTDLGNIHDNNCAACHSGDPSPYDTLNNNWQGGCSQGGCHTTYHADATASHLTVEDQCTQCHGEFFSDFPPLTSSCANCHASYSPSDTSPPTTTSDVQPTYLEPARINYSMTDNGKVGVGTIYTKVDGGPKQAGSSILVYDIGSHTIEFWGVDQAGNEELPHNFATFEVLADTTPPVTTSNAATNYYYDAYITLTATDDNTASGVKATYYSLNGGPIETYQPGTPIFVAKQPATASYTLQFWSEDWFGNVETTTTKNFTVHGYSTLRLVWGNSDTAGSPCPSEPGAAVAWTIRSGTILVSSGTDGCPDWSGVNDVPVSSGRAYSVRLDWYVDGGTFFEDQVIYESVDVPTAGEVIRLQY